MSKLFITRGLPASGKTTWARAWVQDNPQNRIRLNRDEMRRMIHADTGQTTNGIQENLITKMQHYAARQALRAGTDVIVDDTNLRGKTASAWATLASVVGAELVVIDFTGIYLEACLKRNNSRPEHEQVPDEVIRTMHTKFLNGRELPYPKAKDTASEEWQPYTRPDDAPTAYLIDIDGTVAIKGDRDIYDGSKVHLDTVNEDVCAVVRRLAMAGSQMIYMSGRSAEYREVTAEWLKANDLIVDQLHMRPAGDTRKDSIVKHELFNDHVRGRYDVLGVFDDRNQVVEMWRAIGLTVFQVADGAF